MCERGCVLIQVGDTSGWVRNLETGINPQQLLAWKKQTGSICDFPGAESVRGDVHDVLKARGADILVLAAFQNQLHAGNVAGMEARVVVEAANAPVSFEAEKLLNERGVLVLPDIVCSAGGVTVAYFEWLKALANVKFGRMTRQWEEESKMRMLSLWEKMGGEIQSQERREIEQGPTEKDLIVSGLNRCVSASHWRYNRHVPTTGA
ncbi:hypothetical protein BASA81_004166 [Batrachochytrium salamandrivorans]|nr:hypothetical protein BASA81_004166 [Batrachochytrium salamandrivorans]